MTPSVRTLKGSKIKGFQGSTPLCPRGSNARGFSNYSHQKEYKSNENSPPFVTFNTQTLRFSQIKLYLCTVFSV